MNTAVRSLEPHRIQIPNGSCSRISWFVEPLENRIAPATHVWTGLGTDNLWSNPQNWTNGAPDSDLSGDVDLVFLTNLVNTAQLATFNDIPTLIVDSITFDDIAGTVGLTTFATGGPSNNGYTIDGLPLFLKANSPGQDPFGIDVSSGSADAVNGITHTINAGLTLFTSDATFRVNDALAKLNLSSVNIGGNTLTIQNFAGSGSVHITGSVTNGNLVKSGNGTLQLSGSNSFLNATFNGGVIVADNDGALGASGGVVTVNDPARIELRDGVTVTKALLNLNSNVVGGGIGANGNTTNTFRGSVVLMAGAGGVAIGAGVNAENSGTRLIIDGVISGATSVLSLNGAGVIEFTKNNSYSGITTHNGNNGFGAIQINAPGGLGAGGDGNETRLSRNGAGPTGSSLWLNFNGTLQDGAAVGERIDFAGSGVNGLGAIRALENSNVIISGNINLFAGAPWVIGVDGQAGSITTTGVIDDQGGNRALTKIGAGTLNISGSAANGYSGGTIVKEGTLSVTNTSSNPLGDAPTMVAPNGLSLENGSILAGKIGFFDPGFPNAVTALGALISPGLGGGTSVGRLETGPLTLNGASTVRVDITGPTDSDYDTIFANGEIVLGDATLDLRLSYTPTPGTQFFLLTNDANAAAVAGTFLGLPEGARFTSGGGVFTISYVGGNGNDVVLTAVAPESDFALSNGNKTATFTDVDGDTVKVTTTVGQFSAADFTFLSAGDNRHALQKLVLGAGFAGANISIVATATAEGGNGFVNLGFLDATGVDLGSVTVDGDLGQIKAGTVGGSPNVAGVKSLTAQSLGLLNTAMVLSSIEGALPKLTIKGDMRASLEVNGAEDGKLGSVVIGGNITSASTGLNLRSGAGITSLKVGGDIRNAAGASVSISTGGAIGSIQVLGSIVGLSSFNIVSITSFGQLNAPTSGRDLALSSLTVGGSVDFLSLRAGDATTDNADASIGSITVGGNWSGSTVQAGTGAGGDGRIGTNDDAKFAGMGVRDNPSIISQIGSFIVKGQAFGTATNGSDMFGVVAERIGKASVGGRAFAFIADAGAVLHREAFYAAPTGPGFGNGNPSFDFTIREIGSTIASVNFGGVNLVLSADGKTATYTDVDGDLVTVSRSAGTFTLDDFNLLSTGTGGGQLLDLKVTAAPGNATVNLSVSAKPGPDGGNGLANVGEIDATGVALGNVTIGGDIGRFLGGHGVSGKPGVGSFTAKSVGALGTSTGAANLVSSFEDGAGKITIASDVKGTLRAEGDTPNFGTVSIGGSLVNGDLIASRGISTVTIKGSARAAHISSDSGALGSISIGGDLVGDGLSATISALGQLSSPAKGPDLAIKSLDVKGNIDRAHIAVGIGTNADASIGKIAVGREWIASSARAGVNAGKDGFIGTDDDAKTTGSVLRDRSTSFSTISSIIIKGQALGTVSSGDSFGIVAEQIGSAKIGGRSFVFASGARTIGDFFEAAPTRPGVVGFTFDFAIGEITKV